MKNERLMVEKEFIIKLTKWGLNLGLRIPVGIVREHNFKDSEKVIVSNTKTGFEVIKTFPERADNFVI